MRVSSKKSFTLLKIRCCADFPLHFYMLALLLRSCWCPNPLLFDPSANFTQNANCFEECNVLATESVYSAPFERGETKVVARNCHWMAAMVIQRLGMRPMKDARPMHHDHATRPTVHRVDHTSIPAAPDAWSAVAVKHSCSALSQCLHASISMLISRCFIVCFVWISVHLHVCRLHRCLLRIRPLASEKRLHQLKTCAARQWNLRQHPTLALLEHFEAPWRSQVLLFPGASFSTVMVKKGSVPIMANFEPFYLRSVNECGADFWWKYSQDTALQEIPRRNSVLYFWAGPSLVEVAVRTTSWLVSAISHPRRVCASILMLGSSEILELGRVRR